MKAAKIKQVRAVTDGQAAGSWLTERAAHVLLTEFGSRPIDKEGEASQRVSVVMEQLRRALGAMANDPDVSTSLQALDGAIWDCAVEHEDRAWHAAWTLAMNLACGTGSRHAPSVRSK